jgi:hypothetical protein
MIKSHKLKPFDESKKQHKLDRARVFTDALRWLGVWGMVTEQELKRIEKRIQKYKEQA